MSARPPFEPVLVVDAPAPADLGDYGTHYGLPLGAWGEDGDLATLGHVPARLALAAAARARRTVEGTRLRPFSPYYWPAVWHVRAVFLRPETDTHDQDQGDEGWVCVEQHEHCFSGHCVPVTVIDGQIGYPEDISTPTRCPKCARMSTSSDPSGIEHRHCTRCDHHWTHRAGRSRYVRLHGGDL